MVAKAGGSQTGSFPTGQAFPVVQETAPSAVAQFYGESRSWNSASSIFLNPKTKSESHLSP